MGECQKFCVSPITDRATTASTIALTQKNLHSHLWYIYSLIALSYLILPSIIIIIISYNLCEYFFYKKFF